MTEHNTALQEDTTKSQALVIAEKITAEQLNMNQLLGRIQATNAISDMLGALGLSQIASIKASKQYKELGNQTITINDKEYKLNTWEGFCRAIGSTRETVDNKLKDLQLLGEQALENTQALGMTTRELRKLRKLPDDDRAVIIGEIETNIGDKDAIVELIENMSAKHVAATTEIQKQLDDEKAERKATDKVISNKNKKIDELEKQVARQETASAYDRATKFAQEISAVETNMLSVFGEIDKLFQAIQNDAELPEILRVNQGQLLVALKAHSNEILDRFQLGDISVDDDQLDWVAEAKAEAGDLPAYVTGDAE